ncbi:MAG TPA: sigma-70 family RNA polymerase sigma factor [Jatrophihabitans sp.]|nr:sigma-70 family RNA polymerase sigma factor [Jatrophihabitans sp.]
MHGVADEPAASIDDAGLLARLRARDDRAFDEIVRSWSPMMLRVARGFVSTDASAQEVVQETWLGVIRGLASFEGRSSVRTWAFRILVNIAKTRGVKEYRTTPLSSLGPADDAGSTVDPSRFRGLDDPDWPRHWTIAGTPRHWDVDPETGALRAETRALVSAAVDGLPERQRQVIVLRDVHGFESEEVCELLGLTAENQRVLLHRGRAKVRAALEAHLVGEPDD